MPRGGSTLSPILLFILIIAASYDNYNFTETLQ